MVRSWESSTEALPQHPRTLVLCFDGTGNEFSKRNTNVAGIGTYFQPGTVSPIFRSIARLLDEAFAWYLHEHIIDGYKFLMQNYHHGDTVCIFGFSRGAYTARALAGMLHKAILPLPNNNFEQIPFAYKLFKSRGSKSHKLADRFKETFGREVIIDFLGVDTVASVGVLIGRTLPFIGSNNMIKVFRQALSLDERRAMFRPNLYHRVVHPPVPRPKKNRILLQKVAHALNPFKKTVLRRSPDTPHHPPSASNSSGEDAGIKTNVLEVWFAGCHSDVGGGHAKDSKQHALSNLLLRWMVCELAKANCNVHFDQRVLKRWNNPAPGDPAVQAAQAQAHALAVEESFDAKDALKKKGDRLKKSRLWWILEIFPTYYERQDESGQWVGKWSCHRGRGRELPPDPLFHESVRTRMHDKYMGYSPKAKYKKGSEEYVE
ncbi:hypothetical protein BJV74DRAFT_878729 [Russula compacta]|nr:hypothetical protein BJV74DRAFT_878729 [Russula compacta]